MTSIHSLNINVIAFANCFSGVDLEMPLVDRNFDIFRDNLEFSGLLICLDKTEWALSLWLEIGESEQEIGT